jgi:hypothetical protein
MYDGPKVLIGLALFIGVAGVPIWQSLASGEPTPKPELAPAASGSACVESTTYMRAAHMDLLDSWRDAVVRDGSRQYVAADGQRHEMSLSRNCMQCHANASQFCTECHDYAGVTLTCWKCHVAPEGKQ